jgi:hypothetical protein
LWKSGSRNDLSRSPASSKNEFLDKVKNALAVNYGCGSELGYGYFQATFMVRIDS